MFLHGHQIEGDPEGLRYIENLREDESKVLFDEAHDHGKAHFKYLQKHYEVVYTKAGTYVVTHIRPTMGIF